MSAPILADLLKFTRDGEWGKGEPGPGLVEMGVIRGTDFADVSRGDISGIPVRYIPEKAALRKMLQPNDILFETAGGTINQPTGRSVFISESILSASPRPLTCASFARFLRADDEQINPHYLYWFLQYLWNERLICQYHIQHTGVARFQYTQFASEQRVPIRRFKAQREIAATLGALDDKIELNRKAAATLEEMARALYRSWFVDFDPVRARAEGRAPAHMDPATAALFPDSFGEGGLPVGWTIKRIGDLLTLNYGKALRKDQRKPGVFPVYGSGGSDSTHDSALIREPTIIVGRKGTVGSIRWAPGGCWAIDTVFYVTTKYPMPFILRSLQELPLADMNTDAAVPGLNRDNVYRLETAWAGPEVVDAFGQIAASYQKRIDALDAENRTLAALRDTLLPRLMSGELRVRAAREMLEEVA